MDTIKVTCGLVLDADRVFICRRKPGKSLAGFWEFPGGKVEVGESYEECLTRELLEELDMEVQILKPFETNAHDYDAFSIELISFLCRLNSSTYRMIDHDEYQWVRPSELMDLKLAPADVPIAEAFCRTILSSS
jgi:8-oxo-dGTP diphosphatase